jgi:hypothetical protein
MNVEQQFGPFEQHLADSLNAITEAAPSAPSAETILHRLHRRKVRRIRSIGVVLAFLVCGVFLFVAFSTHRTELPESPVVLTPPTSMNASSGVRMKTPGTLMLPKLKFSAISSPRMKFRKRMTGGIPVASVPAGTAGRSPNISLRFTTPRVSLSKL